MKLKKIFAGVATSVTFASAALAQSQGAEPGMMGSSGSAHGMVSGMMGSGGDDRMGAGMMCGYSSDAYAGLDLTAEQQKAIAAVREQASRAMWQQMGTMHGQGYRMQGVFGPGELDEAAARKSFQAMADSQKAMFELQLDARRKIDAVLTNDQRQKLSRYWSSR